MRTGVRSGLLLAVVGLWLIMRATHQDQSGRTLIDHIIGQAGLSPGQVAAGVKPGQTAVTPAQAQTSAGQAVQAAGGVNLQAPTLDPTVVAGGWPTGPPTGPPTIILRGSPLKGQAQIQHALDLMAATGQGLR
jgi:hypothetical protein